MKKRAMVIVLLCAALPVMMAAVLSPALPAMQSEFRGEPDIDVLAKMVLMTPALAIALSAGFIGLLIDRWGRYPLMLASLLLFGIAGMHGLWADDIYAMIAVRFLFGLGVAGIMTVSATWLADYFEGKVLRRVIGLQAGLMGIWGIIFQVMAGYLAEYSWRYPFVLYGSGLILTLCLLSESSLRHHVGHKLHENKSGHSGSRNYKLIFFALLFSASAMSLFALIPVQGPLFFHRVFSLTPRETALLISTLTASSSMASLLLAFWRPHLSFRFALGFGFLGISVGFVVLVLADAWWGLALSMMGIGCGVGVVVPCMSALVALHSPGRMRGRIMGLLLSANYIGQFISPLWAHLVLSRQGDRSLFALSSILALCLGSFVALLPFFDLEAKRSGH